MAEKWKNDAGLTSTGRVPKHNRMFRIRSPKGKVEIVPYSIRSLGPGLIPVSRQSARRLHPAVVFHYFPLGSRLPSQPKSASPPFGHYQILLLGDRGTCVWKTCPGLLHESGTVGIRTRDLLIACPESNALTINTTTPHQPKSYPPKNVTNIHPQPSL